MSLDIKDKNLDEFYAYLRDVLYDSKHADIDLDKMPNEEYRDFAMALMQFGGMVQETRNFAFSLARGELESNMPSRGNELAAPLKSLHATLKHLTWQAKQISGGDYSQHVDFMGEFSDAFNEMVSQLAERRNEMENEAERSNERLEELARANSIFEVITSNMEEWIVMIDRDTGEKIFANHATESVLISETFEQQLYGILYECVTIMSNDDEPRKEVFTLISDYAMQHFEMVLYPIKWYEHNAVACVLTDVTASKEQYERLEDVAYKDVTTGVYNRLFGMNLLDKYTNDRMPFHLVFIDMDMLKYVNDVFGHAEGDAYIRSVADILQEISNVSYVCRLGGDEFMVIIDRKNALDRDIYELFEELREKLKNSATYDDEGNPLYQRSMSYGIIEVGEDNELDVSDILSVADERMYEYKKLHKKERQV